MPNAIYAQYLQAKNNNPRQYARDIATAFGISEAVLMHARVGHDAQRLQGDAKRWLLPGSALAGAGLLIAADTLARTLPAPAEMPVGLPHQSDRWPLLPLAHCHA